MDKKIINLNLITTYPVKWDKYKVLRDFIQNFYDSVPNEEFYLRFTYEYKEGTLTMSCKNVSYNYQWLLHIGASSKTNSEDNYAGYFGEGFKIAALCAIRDFDYQIETSSSDWKIKVIENNIIIDGETTKTLAYELEKYNDEKSDTLLTIKNFNEDDMEYFYSALYSFYYRENPLIGEEIYSSKDYAIYHRSDVRKGEKYPETFDCQGQGIIFASFQARGSLKEPLIFCQNNYVDNDRDRDFFSKLDNIDVIVACIRNITPESALEMLIYYKDKWYSYPKKKYGHSSYYTVIRNLIFRVSSNANLIKKFNNLYPKILYANKIKASDKKALNARKYCLEWLKRNPDYKLVQDSFTWLNVKSIESNCKALRILPEVTELNLKQEEYVTILEEVINDIFKDFFEIDNLPECKVIINLKASVSGYASTIESKEKYKNKYGYKFKNKLIYICIKDIYLNSKGFEGALTTYIHELCHSFGGDKSENFSYAMTTAMEILLHNTERLIKYKEQWKKIKG